MKRRAMTQSRRDRVKLRQYERCGMFPPCALCGKPIMPDAEWIAEHMVPFAIGGADDDGEDNVRPACDECAEKKTNGTAATGRRGDISAIARAVRLASGGKKTRGPKIQSRPFPKPPEGHKRKIQNRPLSRNRTK